MDGEGWYTSRRHIESKGKKRRCVWNKFLAIWKIFQEANIQNLKFA